MEKQQMFDLVGDLARSTRAILRSFFLPFRARIYE
jgi:hypothetical protein